jgi:hypothetical protein
LVCYFIYLGFFIYINFFKNLNSSAAAAPAALALLLRSFQKNKVFLDSFAFGKKVGSRASCASFKILNFYEFIILLLIFIN